MKKFSTLLSTLTLLLLSISSLASCEIYIENDTYNKTPDRQRASIISGQWRGDFGMFYERENLFTRRIDRFDALYSSIRFYSDYLGASSGWGKQIDFYDDEGPHRLMYYSFRWNVRNGVLFLDYPHNKHLNVAIYDYYLNNEVFKGRMGNNSNFVFQLYKLSDFNDWDRFSGDYFTVPNNP